MTAPAIANSQACTISDLSQLSENDLNELTCRIESKV